MHGTAQILLDDGFTLSDIDERPKLRGAQNYFTPMVAYVTYPYPAMADRAIRIGVVGDNF